MSESVSEPSAATLSAVRGFHLGCMSLGASLADTQSNDSVFCGLSSSFGIADAICVDEASRLG